MKTIAKLISLIALVAVTLPCILYFAGSIEHETVIATALAGTIVWFIATPLWMGRKLPIEVKEVEI